MVVPFQPAPGELAHLVTPRAHVPGFGNHLQARQHGVLGYGSEKSAVAVEAMIAPAQHRRQVKTKAVHAHVPGPVTQTVHHQLQYMRLANVQRVAAAAVVFVMRERPGGQPVVAGVVQPPKTQGRPGFVRLGRVVEHHIEQNLHACAVQRLDHGAKFVPWRGAPGQAGQSGVGAKKGQGVVAPVVAQALFEQALFTQAKMHRQQADRRHAELLQVRNRGLMAQPGIGAAQAGRNLGVQFREAFDVQLVQHGVGQRGVRWLVVTPVKGVIHYPPLECEGGVVGVSHRLPCPSAYDIAGIRVKQQSVGIKTMPHLRLPWAVGPQAIEQAGPGVRQVAMPDVMRAGGEFDAGSFLRAGFIKHT